MTLQPQPITDSESQPTSASNPPLQIASVCTVLPTIQRPQQGRFVERRVRALGRIADVRVLQPVPWFPILRPWSDQETKLRASEQPAVEGDVPTADGLESAWPELIAPLIRRRMFYIPKFFKGRDARWLERCITPVLKKWKAERTLDVIDAHFGYPEGVGCVRAGRRLGIPVFITVRGNEVHYLRHPSIGPQLREALQQCAGVVTVSHALKDAVEGCGIEESRVRVIPNAVDTAMFRPGDRGRVRARLCLPPEARVIVIIASLVQEKGVHLLVEALAALRKREPNCVLFILGAAAHERQYPASLRQLAAELEVTEAVCFLGAQPPETVALWLQAADLFALPTFREGCNNSIIEALACGLPVVTTAVGENPWFVTPPFNGSLVPVGDVAALTEALEHNLKRSWDNAAIAQQVAQRGNWDKCARDTIGFFEQQLCRMRGPQA